MLEDAKAGKFDIIVVKSLSRLSRNLMDCMDIIYKLRKLPNPVGILFETENMFTLDRNVDFTLQVLSLVAQEESHKKSEAIIAAYKARCSQGIYRKPDLLGYDSIGVNEIAVNVEEAQTVQLMFMMYLSGIDCTTIAEVLTMLGRKTHTHKLKSGIVREARDRKGDYLKLSNADLAGCEVVRPQFFSLREKACITLDKRGINFNKMCLNKLEKKLGESIKSVRLTYNAVERLLIVHPERDENESILAWCKSDKASVQMRRCPAKGIADALYSNMDWNDEYKYRFVGSIVRDERGTGEPAIVFSLNEPFMIVPIYLRDVNRETQLDETNNAKAKGKTAKKSIRDGYEIEDGYSFDDFSDEVEQSRDIHTAKSHAIYYDDLRKKLSATLNVEAMGAKKYSPDFIRTLLQHNMMPVEGWSYLDGMAIIRKNSFQIYPSEWADTFGKSAANQNRWVFACLSQAKAARQVESIPYGWTVGLDLPSRETVNTTIKELG